LEEFGLRLVDSELGEDFGASGDVGVDDLGDWAGGDDELEDVVGGNVLSLDVNVDLVRRDGVVGLETVDAGQVLASSASSVEGVGVGGRAGLVLVENEGDLVILD